MRWSRCVLIGGDGVVPGIEENAFADVVLQPDGKIVASQSSGFSVWRLEGDGSAGAPATPEADDPTPTPALPSTPSTPAATAPAPAATSTPARRRGGAPGSCGCAFTAA